MMQIMRSGEDFSEKAALKEFSQSRGFRRPPVA
jgi:hypothetical protein